MPRFLRLAVALLACLGLSAQAQQANDLYDATAPANSAFVRVFNLGNAPVEVTLSSKKLPQKVGAGQLGGYRFTSPGPTRVSVGQAALDLPLEANTAVTLLYRDGQLSVLRDLYANEPKKAQLAFYNLAAEAASLKTLDGRHAVVADVAAAQNGSRQVNEFKIAFAAFIGERQVAVFDELFLKRGRSYSYVLLADGGAYRALALPNEIDPTE